MCTGADKEGTRAALLDHVCACRRWHNGFRTKEMTPTYRGFDTFFGYWHCCSDYWTHSLDNWIDQTNASGASLIPDFGHQQEYSAFLYAREAARLISLHPPSRPLYLYLPFESVHGPIEAPDQYVGLYNETIVDTKRRIFSGMLTAMDSAVHTVVEALKARELWRDTLLFCESSAAAPPGS
jgi:arylsulfatase B